MTSELIIRSDVLDILFEKRNKAYGAYMLRKFYKNRLAKALGAMLSVVMAFSALTLIPEKTAGPVDYIFADPGFTKILPSAKISGVKPKPITPVKIKRTSTIKWISNILIVDKKEATEMLRDLHNSTPGSHTVIISNTIVPSLVITASAAVSSREPLKVITPATDITKPVDNPDIMPQYPGGMDALRRFLINNLTNPRDLQDGELISVKIRFIVGYDGKLQRFDLEQDGGSEFNNEVIRVLKKMPAWIPGRSKGQNVSVFYTIPVKFVGEG